MLFVNISSDKVQIADAKQEKFLDRNSIENTLGKCLIDRYKQSPFQEILLLNGPGGFTNLRVGTLTLNLLNKLLGAKVQRCKGAKESLSTYQTYPPIRLFSITKLDFYTYLFKKGLLSSKGVIYIGQKDNVRLYDAKKKTYSQIKLDTIKKDSNLFFDFTKEDYRGENTSNMISFHMKEKGLEVQRKKKSMIVTIKDLGIKAQTQAKPEYMIEAVL
ncbi:MAG: hypothetical protein CO170_02300 [candidate division SR1 bacterium CG_4_9_14_3_um_filter_40_9]|nr:MAG: hypothetical protein CO170_02300 [candidate division SR1 bacterium CG_4_9_14_3_um_filter_40_9]